MRIGVSETVKKIILEDMIEKGVESVTKFGITFSTQKSPSSLPTGERTKDGQMIYIQP